VRTNRVHDAKWGSFGGSSHRHIVS
jgi:hypothetical protein